MSKENLFTEKFVHWYENKNKVLTFRKYGTFTHLVFNTTVENN